MPRVRSLQRAFTGGVLSPSLWGHVEDSKFLTGAAVMENMIPWPQGKLSLRPGTEFVAEVADSTKTSVLRAFGAGSSQGYTVGIEAGLFRFYIDGATLLWATARKISSIDTSANTITFTAPHGFTADQQVWLVKPAASTAPTGVGITVTAPMFVIVTNTTTIQISATSLGSAIDIATAGSGDLWFYADSEMPDLYVSSKNASGVTAGSDLLNITSHGLAHGNPIRLGASFTFTATAATNLCTAGASVDFAGTEAFSPVTVSSSTTLPGGLVAGTTYYAYSFNNTPGTTFYLFDAPNGNIIDITSTGSGTHTLQHATGAAVLASTPALYVGTTYYARVNDANSITIHLTAAAAIAGTGAVDITGAGNGTTRVHYAYTQGDLVNYPNSGVYYCEIDYPDDSAPGGADWYLLPFTGEYQIPNPYVESNLLYLDRDQIGDAMTFAHPDHGLYELVREADLRWTFTRISLAPEIDPPQGVAGTATLGENLECTYSIATPSVFTTGSTHDFGGGVTTVYLTVLTGTFDAGSGLYVVNTGTAGSSTFTLKSVDGGEPIASATGGTALVQQSSLAAEIENHYFVTAIRPDGVESDVSTEITVTNNLFVSGAYNTITWLAVTGAERYRVYKSKHGLAGIIGETYETSFRDDNIAPDMSYTPPRFDDDIGNPGVVASFEQRRVLSGVETDNQSIWFTDLGTTTSLAFHIPVLDTDRISFELQSPLQAAVRFISPSANLVVFTESTEFVMTTVDSEALTPTSFRARPVSYVGCSIVKPLLVNDLLFFCGSRGGHVYEFSLRAAFEGYKPKDVSIRAPHLFDGYTIVDSAYQKSPIPVQWYVRSDGALLGYTFSSEEEVGGWHVHTTDGAFERICVAAEGTEDRVYFIVRRTIDGNTVRYVERFAPFAEVTDIADAFHVDCGLAYSGAAASTISGYDHLEGETVVANVAGQVVKSLTVSSGDVATGVSSTTAVIGLPFTGTFQSLPVAVNADGAAVQGRVKGPVRAYARVLSSGPFKMGPTDVDIEMVPCGTAEELTTDEARIALPGTWSEGGQLFIVQPNPLPLNIVALTIDVELGGG